MIRRPHRRRVALICASLTTVATLAATTAGAAPAAVAGAAGTVAADEVVATLEKLHGLIEKGVLSPEEFAAKKAELLKKLS